MTLGELIRLRREARGFTQERLGELVGLDRTDVSRIETGAKVRTLSATIIVAIADTLDIPRAVVSTLGADFEQGREPSISVSIGPDGRIVVPPAGLPEGEPPALTEHEFTLPSEPSAA